MHARNKPLDRSNDDALLRQIADLAIGYSGAELANLMNEAAILAVSFDCYAFRWFLLQWCCAGQPAERNEAAILAVSSDWGSVQWCGHRVLIAAVGEQLASLIKWMGRPSWRCVRLFCSVLQALAPGGCSVCTAGCCLGRACIQASPSALPPPPPLPALQVRRSQAEIDLPILKEAMDKIRLGEGWVASLVATRGVAAAGWGPTTG